MDLGPRYFGPPWKTSQRDGRISCVFVYWYELAIQTKGEIIRQSQIDCMFLWNFNHRWRTGSPITHSTGYVNLHTCPCSVILKCLPNAPRNPFTNYQYFIYPPSKPGFSYTATLATSRTLSNQTWFLKNTKVLKYTPGADPRFQVRGGGDLKKIAPSGGRR
jgi:hypothetical protein